ncbi:cingulin-like protein 1 [Ruditapes philippinarum]|uniref:cingulin-like protein 1 n=1 Tax=Ruditapes philippinarum TaxID=129788 RepID=UPI00295C02A9|nr:cingulin-like protein 1 [Ruditapes philippinarum]
MDETAKTVLENNKAHIKINMRIDEEILDALEATRTLNHEEIEDIQAERTDTRKISMLLRILPRKGPHAFQSFVNAIITDYPFLAEELIEEYHEIKRSHTNNDEKELEVPYVPEENSTHSDETKLKAIYGSEESSTNRDETELKANHVPEESCTKSDETELKAYVPEESGTKRSETELKANHVPEVSCTKSDATKLKANHVPEVSSTIRDETELKAYVPEVSGTKIDETELKANDVPEKSRKNSNQEKSITNSNQTENPEESRSNSNEDQNAINNLQESIRALHRAPTYASMSMHSDHNSTQSHLNIIYMMLKMHLIFMNEREDFFGSPELATFVMIKPLLEKVIDLGQESYRLVRGAHRVSLKRCIETMRTENTNLQGRLLEREQRIQKYANKIRLLETKIQDYEAQLRQKDNRLNQKESELEEARSIIQTLESQLENAESSLRAKQEEFDTNNMKLTELTEENKELKKKVAANENIEHIQNYRNRSTRYNNVRGRRKPSNDQNLGISGFQLQKRL